MALSRYNATTGLLGNAAGKRHGMENPDGLLGKVTMGKSRATSAAQRAPLGNISNRTTGQNVQKKGIKDGLLTRSKAAEQLKEQKAEPKKMEKAPPPAPASPAPMDMSANSQGEEAFSKQLLALNMQKVTDIDKDDQGNPQLVAEYVNDIYDYMRELERKFPVKHHFLEGQDINARMRGILIDWLVQVHLRFHLLQETLYLTVAIIDRFLQVQEVSRNKLQLVGVTAMLLASKYEEMYAPEISDFVYITDNAYTKSDIRKMECLILSSLDFNLGRPLPLHFLRRNSKAGEVDATKHTLAKYLMELTIVDYESAHFHPSEVAAAALFLSMQLLDKAAWNDTLAFYSKYSESDLKPIMRRMAHLVQRAGTGKLTAVKTKYQSSKLMKISLIPELQSKVIEELAQSDGS